MGFQELIALICPSNRLFMPYVESYIRTLDKLGMEYTLINWDRMDIEEDNEFTFGDNKTKHQRGAIDYFRFRRFVIKKLKQGSYKKVILFGVQLACFLGRYIQKNYYGRFVLDIRDYNRVLKIYDLREMIENSQFTVISSPGFMRWLPPSEKYIINHNIDSSYGFLQNPTPCAFNNGILKLSTIGSLKDLQPNITLIDELADNENIRLYYHGEGIINNALIEHIQSRGINNVIVTGKYEREEERELYEKSDVVSDIRFATGINNLTLLSNRLYKAIACGKPVLALDGTYSAEMIKKYDLGLVVDQIEGVGESLEDYLLHFDQERFSEARSRFFRKVLRDNRYFVFRLSTFAK